MKVTGKEKINFVTEEIDYLLTVYLTDRVERDEKTGLVELGDPPIPYQINGTFSNLNQSASIRERAKAKAKEVLLDTLEKQFSDDKDTGKSNNTDAGSLINQGLKGLFGK